MVVTSAPTYVATRQALTGLSPQDLTAVRFLGAAVVLGIFLLVRRQSLRLRTRHLPRMIATALLGYAGYGLLLNVGQTTVPAGTTSLLLNISPVFAFFLGFVVLKERTSLLGYTGIVVAVIGVVIITLGGSSAVGFNMSALYIVAAALVLAVFLIVQQPLLRELPAVEVVFWGSALGGLATLPATDFAGGVNQSQLGVGFWFALLVLIVVSTCLAYGFWNVSLARTSVAQGGSLLYVVPVFSLLLGWWLFGEVPSIAAWIGGVLALAGVVVLSIARPRVRSSALPAVQVVP
ncbi:MULTISPECIES: DMT family transporter [Subtercola]|uniref:DMT family transporter n=1 Tax=Subtercola vilae TaxID=2056433 RepID=A0A4T2BY93_9MICO|nr:MULTISPECIES: DMT family transporter [Subtercola]MEA9986059.1 DMT family transporter [Subtercola sp. RTI3]TIH36923.1 DMT family transporter [Subtercola vilae]